MKIYIAGPMSGYAEHNFPEFYRVAYLLRELGHEVVNPADINPVEPGLKVVPGDFNWVRYMQNDIKQLIYCDAVYALRGWEKSKGASLECAIAKGLGFIIIEQEIEPL